MISDPKQLAILVRDFALDKKALDPVVLDLRGISSFTDFFVICSATSEPHLKAVANGVEKGLKDEYETRPLSTDGYPASQWVAVDFGSVILHIFLERKRHHYALEELWGDAKRVR
jgi:ribosome-associated protein